MIKYDLVVIGAGSGGISTARKASSYGVKVLVIEQSRMGGTCVNAGCVPKKVTSNLAHILYNMNTNICESYGIKGGNNKDIDDSKDKSINSCKKNDSILDEGGCALNFKDFVYKRNKHVQKLNNIFQKIIDDDPNIDLIKGRAELHDGYILADNKRIEYKFCILATGSQPKPLNRKEMKKDEPLYVNGTRFLQTSEDFFKMDKVPKKSVIIGSGYIGIELGFILRALGSEVHVIARSNNLLSSFDSIIGESIIDAMKRKDLNIHLNTKVKEIKEKCIILEENGNIEEIKDIDFMLCAIGRDCDLSFIKTEIKNKNNYLIVDGDFKTSVKNVFAIGDLIGPEFMLTPVAIFCGRILAEHLFSRKNGLLNESLSKNDHMEGDKLSLIEKYRVYDCVPSVIFSHPPSGSIGISEKAARKMNGEVKVYLSTFKNTYYALLEDDDEKETSKFKIVTLDNKVVGLHLFGKGVDEMIQGFAVAMKMGASFDDFKRTVPVHPTAAEEVVTMK